MWASVRRDRRTGLRLVLATSPPREAEAREIENGRLRPEHCSKLLIGAWRHGGIALNVVRTPLAAIRGKKTFVEFADISTTRSARESRA